MTTNKRSKLKEIINSYSSMTIAFSGGTDSTLLAAVASEVLGDKLLLVHIASPMAPLRETRFAQEWAFENNFNIKTLHLNPLEDEQIKSNCKLRCYYCKTLIMKSIIEESQKHNIDIIADGTNTDDYNDYRPGLKATAELNIKHPLAEAGFSKRDIRLLAKEYGIANWNTPAAACLATRIPTNTPLDIETLKRVGISEEFLNSLGFDSCRIRVLGNVAKIELPVSELPNFIQHRETIVNYLKKHGFSQVLLDMEGYKMGSMNSEN